MFRCESRFIYLTILQRGNRGFGAGCQVFGVRGSVSGVRCQGFGVRCSVSGVRCSVFGVRGSVSGVRCQGFGVRCQGFGVRCQGFGVRCSVFGVRCLTPSLREGSFKAFCPSSGGGDFQLKATALLLSLRGGSIFSCGKSIGLYLIRKIQARK